MSETMMSQANENTENVDQKALELAQDKKRAFCTFTGTGGCNSERQCNI